MPPVRGDDPVGVGVAERQDSEALPTGTADVPEPKFTLQMWNRSDLGPCIRSGGPEIGQPRQ